MGLPGQSAQQRASERGYPNSNIRGHLRNVFQGLRLTLTLTHACVACTLTQLYPTNAKHTERSRKNHVDHKHAAWEMN